MSSVVHPWNNVVMLIALWYRQSRAVESIQSVSTAVATATVTREEAPTAATTLPDTEASKRSSESHSRSAINGYRAEEWVGQWLTSKGVNAERLGGRSKIDVKVTNAKPGEFMLGSYCIPPNSTCGIQVKRNEGLLSSCGQVDRRKFDQFIGCLREPRDETVELLRKLTQHPIDERTGKVKEDYERFTLVPSNNCSQADLDILLDDMNKSTKSIVEATLLRNVREKPDLLCVVSDPKKTQGIRHVRLTKYDTVVRILTENTEWHIGKKHKTTLHLRKVGTDVPLLSMQRKGGENKMPPGNDVQMKIYPIRVLKETETVFYDTFSKSEFAS